MTIKHPLRTEFQPGRGYTQEDWDAVDSPPLTDEELASLRPAREVLAPAVIQALENASLRLRGRPKIDNAKVAVTLRLDPAVLEKFKASGKDWRTTMADELRKASGKF